MDSIPRNRTQWREIRLQSSNGAIMAIPMVREMLLFSLLIDSMITIATKSLPTLLTAH